MQVVDHIVTCPLLNQERGLEPYPQPVVCFAASVSGTAQVRIYDTSVQPMVELTTTALSGAELSAVTATGLTYAYTLDMGHANVTSVVDLMNREGFEGVVMFEDSGGTGEKIYVKISANTPEQVAFLYPDNAVFLDRNSASTGTNFPDGSIFRPVNLIADACTLVTSRGADILDVVGNFTPSTDEWTNAKLGTALEGKQIRCRPGQYSIIESHDNTGLSLDRCHIKGSNHNLSLRNDTGNSSGFWGGIFVEDCSLWGFGSNGNTGTHPVIRGCLIERFCDGAGNPPVWIDCEFTNLGSIDIGDYSNYRDARFVRPSGAKLSLVGNYQGSTRYLTITDVQGMLPIEMSVAIRNGVNISITGAYGDLQIDGLSHSQPPVVTTSKLAGYDDLVGNVVNLAAGSITPTEAPNLDVAVSSVGGGGGGTDWTSTEKEQIRQRLSLDGTQADPTTAAGDFETLLTNVDATVSSRSSFDATSDTVTISGTLGTLDALDTQQDIQHAATQADITTLLSRIGANDIGIIKGLLLGNYVLDGGSGNVSATYDANGCMTSGRIRVFANSTATAAATKGAANGADSEIARVDLTATAVTGQAYPQNVTGLLT